MFIPWASLKERIEELHEMLREHYGEKVLSSYWRVLYRMKVLVRRLTSKHDTVGCTTRGLLGREFLSVGRHTHTCARFLDVEAGTKRASFDFATRFIMLHKSRHLAAIRSTILENKGCNQSRGIFTEWCSYSYFLWSCFLRSNFFCTQLYFKYSYLKLIYTLVYDSSKYFYFILSICLHKLIWIQVTNNDNKS